MFLIWFVLWLLFFPFSAEKFDKLLYGLRRLWTAITRAPLKIDAGCLHQTEVEQFNGIIEINSRMTLVVSYSGGSSSSKLGDAILQSHCESSTLSIPIGFPHQFMKLSNIKISSRIISYTASKYPILIDTTQQFYPWWQFLLHHAKLGMQNQKVGTRDAVAPLLQCRTTTGHVT